MSLGKQVSLRKLNLLYNRNNCGEINNIDVLLTLKTTISLIRLITKINRKLILAILDSRVNRNFITKEKARKLRISLQKKETSVVLVAINSL